MLWMDNKDRAQVAVNSGMKLHLMHSSLKIISMSTSKLIKHYHSSSTRFASIMTSISSLISIWKHAIIFALKWQSDIQRVILIIARNISLTHCRQCTSLCQWLTCAHSHTWKVLTCSTASWQTLSMTTSIQATPTSSLYAPSIPLLVDIQTTAF